VEVDMPDVRFCNQVFEIEQWPQSSKSPSLKESLLLEKDPKIYVLSQGDLPCQGSNRWSAQKLGGVFAGSMERPNAGSEKNSAR
jgi:hypothetical protein